MGKRFLPIQQVIMVYKQFGKTLTRDEDFKSQCLVSRNSSHLTVEVTGYTCWNPSTKRHNNLSICSLSIASTVSLMTWILGTIKILIILFKKFDVCTGLQYNML